jgi:zinc transport system substrate-binding protein
MTVGVFTGCNNQEEKTAETKAGSEQKIEVIVSFNPLKEFVEAVGKEKVNIKTIVPEGTEPHDFEPKPKDMESISKAKMFVYNGLGVESWVEKTLEVIENKDLLLVEASKGVDLLKNTDSEEVEEHGEYDPHTWLSLKEAKVEAKNIKEALVKADSANKDFYEKNYEEFAKKLEDVYNDYKKKFDTVTNKNFVTGHAAFGYLCRDFGLEQKSVESVFAEGEPTPQKMKELVDFSKANKIKTIFMEELASPKVSETIAREAGANVEKIYTIESKEDDKDYIESMKSNLEKIYQSLK